jgi:hypothetical protein
MYYDLKRIAPNLPDFPLMSKCNNCNTIFWLNEQHEIGKYGYGEKENPDCKNHQQCCET